MQSITFTNDVYNVFGKSCRNRSNLCRGYEKSARPRYNLSPSFVVDVGLEYVGKSDFSFIRVFS